MLSFSTWYRNLENDTKDPGSWFFIEFRTFELTVKFQDSLSTFWYSTLDMPGLIPVSQRTSCRMGGYIKDGIRVNTRGLCDIHDVCHVLYACCIQCEFSWNRRLLSSLICGFWLTFPPELMYTKLEVHRTVDWRINSALLSGELCVLRKILWQGNLCC